MRYINKMFPPGTQRRARARLLAGSVWRSQYPVRTAEDFNKPFFIVGSGRCGTTLLRRLLQASPDVYIPPENWALGTMIGQFHDYRTSLNWQKLSGLLLNSLLLKNQGWYESVPLSLFQQLNDFAEQEKTLANFIDFNYRFHGRYLGATFTRWGDKTPLNVKNMFTIRKVFPQAKFIFMQRDPADVISSWSKVDKYIGEVERPALRWKSAFADYNAFRRQYPEQIISMRYEDLVTNPAAEVMRIAKYVGIKYQPEWITESSHLSDMADAAAIPHLKAALDKVTTSSIGKGRKCLTDEQKQTINSHIASEIDDAGYQELV